MVCSVKVKMYAYLKKKKKAFPSLKGHCLKQYGVGSMLISGLSVIK